MRETTKLWLTKLYSEEIDNVKGAISNERIWVNGSEGEQVKMHEQNIIELEEYLGVLEERLAKISI